MAAKLEDLIEEYIRRDFKEHIISEIDDKIESRVEQGEVKKEDAQKVSEVARDHTIDMHTTREKIHDMASAIADSIGSQIHEQVIWEIEGTISDIIDDARESVQMEEDV